MPLIRPGPEFEHAAWLAYAPTANGSGESMAAARLRTPRRQAAPDTTKNAARRRESDRKLFVAYLDCQEAAYLDYQAEIDPETDATLAELACPTCGEIESPHVRRCAGCFAGFLHYDGCDDELRCCGCGATSNVDEAHAVDEADAMDREAYEDWRERGDFFTDDEWSD